MAKETPTQKEKGGIRLNKQTVGNLMDYLQEFDSDAKVTIWHDYKTFDCQICCNFEHQHETSTVNIMLGDFIEKD